MPVLQYLLIDLITTEIREAVLPYLKIWSAHLVQMLLDYRIPPFETLIGFFVAMF